MYIVEVDYNEFDPESYRGIGVKNTRTGEIEVREESGDFMEDYRQIKGWAEEALDDGDKLLSSSSFDNYLIDSSYFWWREAKN